VCVHRGQAGDLLAFLLQQTIANYNFRPVLFTRFQMVSPRHIVEGNVQVYD